MGHLGVRSGLEGELASGRNSLAFGDRWEMFDACRVTKLPSSDEGPTVGPKSKPWEAPAIGDEPPLPGNLDSPWLRLRRQGG